MMIYWNVIAKVVVRSGWLVKHVPNLVVVTPQADVVLIIPVGNRYVLIIYHRLPVKMIFMQAHGRPAPNVL
jgi:hypothetical protein